MLHTTKGIVLRSVKYGETSVVLTVYTEKFGLQSYIVNGVRTEKKSGAKAALYHPANLLELIVYHHPNKNLQRIKEAKYLHIKSMQVTDVIKYSLSIYMVELILKTITESEPNEELFSFFEENFLSLSQTNISSNHAIVFTIELAAHLGYAVLNNYSNTEQYFNLYNGSFTSEQTTNLHTLAERDISLFIHQIISQPNEELKINSNKRLEILNVCIQYLRLHIPHLGDIKSASVLHELLN